MGVKTTVEIPDELMERAKRYAVEHRKTFKQVLVDALDRTIGSPESDSRPGWARLGGCPGVPREEFDRIQADIDEEFEVIDPREWE